MVTMVVLLSLQRQPCKRPPKKERGFYARCESGASFSTNSGPQPRSAAGEAWRQAAPFESTHQGSQAPALHALHDPLHLLELLEQAVDVLNLNPGASCD